VAVDAGVLPDELVATSIHRAPEQPPPSVPLGVYGPDVVRDADGRFVVLEDNCRTPTLMGYAAGVRELSLGTSTRPPACGRTPSSWSRRWSGSCGPRHPTSPTRSSRCSSTPTS
jgi:hypothetical protein